MSEGQKKQEAVGVEIRDLVKTFPAYDQKNKEIYAANHVTLSVKPGEMVTLLGPSGCGKPSLLRMVAGFLMPSSGEIYIGNREVSKIPPNKRNVGMMFQSYALFPHLSVYDNVAYGLKLKHMGKQEIQDRVRAILQLMQIEDYASRFPNEISGGQQQRVALARAVVTEPSVLLFDEPLSNLDAKLREYMREELRKIQKRVGITSLYVTHDQSEAMAISDKVIIMRSGTIEQTGTAMEIYARPKNQGEFYPAGRNPLCFRRPGRHHAAGPADDDRGVGGVPERRTLRRHDPSGGYPDFPGRKPESQNYFQGIFRPVHPPLPGNRRM